LSGKKKKKEMGLKGGGNSHKRLEDLKMGGNGENIKKGNGGNNLLTLKKARTLQKVTKRKSSGTKN